MFDEKTLAASRRRGEENQAGYDRMLAKFADAAPARATAPKTASGIPLKNVYHPHDIEGLDHEAIGAPGQFPFTRGNLPAQYQFMNWANQPVIGYGLPEHTRARMDALSARGMTGYFGQKFYNLVYDLVSHEGLDPDHPAARGRVGQCGMAVYSKQDMARLFDGLDLREMNVIHITYYQVVAALAQYLALADEWGVDRQDLRGNTMNWYHQSAYVGMTAFAPESGHKLAVELINYCNRNMPRWNTTNMFCYGIEEAGGTAVQEIGFMLAYGIDLVRACMASGLTADQALLRVGFQVSQANDFFEEICKVRALRRIWATTMRDKFGANDPRGMHVRIHCHTSGVSLTSQQPLVNLIRTSLHTLGASLSGVQAMEVSAYDEALGIPTEVSATLALRVQQVIQEETNVTAVTDPLAGSYYVESLTDDIAKAALELVEQVEAQGGYIAAQKSGWIRRQVEASAERWRDEVSSGERRIVGMNCYTQDEETEPQVFEYPEEVERVAVERIKELRATRNASKFNDAMAGFTDKAQAFAKLDHKELGDTGLLEAATAAARADATTGEIMGVLKTALGWSAPHEY